MVRTEILNLPKCDNFGICCMNTTFKLCYGRYEDFK